MSTLSPEPYTELDVGSPTGPNPGREVVGPSPVDFVIATREALRAELALYRHAQLESRERTFELTKSAQADSNGDALIELFSVPGGSTGYLTRLTVDTPASTPANPITNANLWLAVIALASAGITTPPVANRVPLGSMLYCSPNSPAADAQIPCVLVDAESLEGSPTLVGPATFYLQIDAATASLQYSARFCVVTKTPEP